MPRIQYAEINFRASSRTIITQANEIITEYVAQGFDLTLRQLYYQFVSRGILPNTKQSYKRLGSIINDGRMAGLIDWDNISDRTRNLRELAHWASPQEVVSACSRQFRFDKWEEQPYRIEVWIEKDALIGVIEGVCNELDVPYFSCRGYTSQSEMWGAGQRIRNHRRNSQKVVILHLGDHDPSGIDMSRDIRDRLTLFTGNAVDLRRLALNMPQVEQYGPPPNPAKDTDSRSPDYNRVYGDESWELDALEPTVIAALIREAVVGVREEDLWTAAVAREQEARGQLTAVADNWDDVITALPEDDDDTDE